MDCKTPMKGRVKDPSEKQELFCPKCRAVYDIEFGVGQTIKRTMRQNSYKCGPCGEENWVGVHRVVEGQVFRCRQCGKGVRVTYALESVDTEEEAREK